MWVNQNRSLTYQSSIYNQKSYINHTITNYQWIWANYNNSLTWIKAIWGWFPLLTMIPVRSQWGRYNLPRMDVKISWLTQSSCDTLPCLKPLTHFGTSTDGLSGNGSGAHGDLAIQKPKKMFFNRIHSDKNGVYEWSMCLYIYTYITCTYYIYIYM